MRSKIRTIMIVIPLLALAAAHETSATVTVEYPDPVLFVHGLGGDSTNFNILSNLFRNNGWPDNYRHAHDFPDPWNSSGQGLIDDAHAIEQWVTDILSSTGAQKVDIIAHSMGGLSSRYYLKFLNGTDHVDDFVSLGSPHHGALPLHDFLATSCFASNTTSTFVPELNEGDETPGGNMTEETGERYDSIMDVTYNGTHVPGDVNYTAIYSRDDGVVTPYNTSRLEGANNIVLEGYTHYDLVTSTAVFEHVKQAVNDGKTFTTTTTTTTGTSSTVTSSTTAAVTVMPFLVAFTIIALTSRRRERE